MPLDGPEPTLTVRAAHSKHRKENVLPLRESTAGELEAFLRGLMPQAPVFGIPKRWRAADMLAQDLSAAKLKRKDDEGRIADFHALRHTFITNLAQSGVHPKTAQALARHSTISLTMDRYTHALRSDERRALDALPDFSSTEA